MRLGVCLFMPDLTPSALVAPSGRTQVHQLMMMRLLMLLLQTPSLWISGAEAAERRC